jgi:hypothetical protein
MVFGQHVHPTSIPQIFSSGVVKDTFYSSKPGTETERRENRLLVRKLQIFLQNSFHRCKEYLRVEGQRLLWSLNCNYFISNVVGRHVCWFTSKIRMHIRGQWHTGHSKAQSRGSGQQCKSLGLSRGPDVGCLQEMIHSTFRARWAMV